MHYKGRLRKEVMPIKLKSFLELVSYDKYDYDELYNLIYPLSTIEDKSNLNYVYNFAKEIEMIQELSGGKVIYNEGTGIKILDNGIDENAFKEYTRKALFKSEESLFQNITRELLSYDLGKVFFQRNEDLIRALILNQNVTDEDMLAYRFWSKYLGYSYNLKTEFLIINPYKYINILNNRILEADMRIPIRTYIEQLQYNDNIFREIVKDNEISESVSIALKTLEADNKLKLILENDAGDLWRLKNITESDDARISHIELGVYS